MRRKGGGGEGAMEGRQKARSASSRMRDILRALPVIAIVLLAALLYVVYLLLHAMPLLQVNVSPDLVDAGRRKRGIVELVIFHVFCVMFVVNYVMTIITPAGTIPRAPEWELDSSDFAASPCEPRSPSRSPHSTSPFLSSAVSRVRNPSPRQHPPLLEQKKSGAPRTCKWCGALKPDRCHHCRVCGQCILRMDHHCPWVYNCIGWGNRKYFVLLVFYTSLTLLFAVITQLESIKRAIDEPSVPFGNLFLLLFSETLGTLLAFVSASFFFFHMWLTARDMSTIEFCERKFRRSEEVDVYDRGCWKNFRAALGKNPVFWCLPIDDREGDGMTFVRSEEQADVGQTATDVEYGEQLLVARNSLSGGGGVG